MMPATGFAGRAADLGGPAGRADARMGGGGTGGGPRRAASDGRRERKVTE
jgi:hypothetical protein